MCVWCDVCVVWRVCGVMCLLCDVFVVWCVCGVMCVICVVLCLCVCSHICAFLSPGYLGVMWIELAVRRRFPWYFYFALKTIRTLSKPSPRAWEYFDLCGYKRCLPRDFEWFMIEVGDLSESNRYNSLSDIISRKPLHANTFGRQTPNHTCLEGHSFCWLCHNIYCCAFAL